MKSISPRVRTLIQQLYSPAGFWKRQIASQGNVQILTEIGSANEPAAIVDVLPFVLALKRGVADAAANTVNRLVSACTPADLVWLDYALRQRSPYSGDPSYEWYKLSPEQLDLLERFGEHSLSLLGMASFHQSGYVRQAAIERLDRIASGAELPYLILRLNDWVSNVRDVAYQAIRSRLRPEYGRSFIANLPLVSRLEKAGRSDHKALIHTIDNLLQSDSCRTALLELLKSEDRFIRRTGFRLALASTDSELPEIVRQSLEDHDTVVRLWAAQTVSSAFTGTELDQFLESMKSDRFMPVRREALRICVRRRVEHVLEELRSALLDTHASMREEARYHLRTIAPMDVAAFYRLSLVAEGSINLYAAICGLGETGSEMDDRLIIPFVSDRAAKIRGAAIRALARLNGKAHAELFLNALKDEGPNVSREALKALAARTSAISGEKVWEIFDSSSRLHVRRNALSLLERLTKWDRLYYLLKALRNPDEGLVDRSRLWIEGWLAEFNLTFTLPTGNQIARVRTALEECGDLLDEKSKQQIIFSIKTF